ncbi:hypothetical protein [Marinomonas sp. THO17]|uniref:hypothetical protein n=1 Tax=Marinomonas sp. THO17 TaxID=3149048 RepID=UPI00336BB455
MHSEATLALGAFAIFFVGIAMILALTTVKKYRQHQADRQKLAKPSNGKSSKSKPSNSKQSKSKQS